MLQGQLASIFSPLALDWTSLQGFDFPESMLPHWQYFHFQIQAWTRRKTMTGSKQFISVWFISQTDLWPGRDWRKIYTLRVRFAHQVTRATCSLRRWLYFLLMGSQDGLLVCLSEDYVCSAHRGSQAKNGFNTAVFSMRRWGGTGFGDRLLGLSKLLYPLPVWLIHCITGSSPLLSNTGKNQSIWEYSINIIKELNIFISYVV